MNITGRMKEPSSFAGMAGLMHAIPTLLSDPRNPEAWGIVIASVLAILIREKGGEK